MPTLDSPAQPLATRVSRTLAAPNQTWDHLSRRWSVRTVLAWCGWINLAAVALVLVLICYVSERWWASALLTYLPRSLWGGPSIVLLPAALWLAPRTAWLHLLSLVLVAGPIMGLSIPTESPPIVAAGRTPLRIVSGNIQEGAGDIHRLIDEVTRFRPDIVALQETARGTGPLHEAFADWRRVHLGEFFVASRFPLRVVDHCRPAAFDRWTAVLVEIETPDGPVRLCNTHLSTPRHGATGLTPWSLLTGDGVEEFAFHLRLRSDEAAETRAFLDRYHEHPRLAAGDFNTPTTSSLFAPHWGDWQSAFETAGWGYGYTAPCNTDRWWPRNRPWVRIDHILADERWAIHECRIGRRDGSDHRLVFAEVSLRAPRAE